jgi:hypothetical protein
VDTLWPTLVQFTLRLSFGLAVAMACTPARWVTSGFYRVHLWVVMGLGTFTALAVWTYWNTYTEHAVATRSLFSLTVALAATSYVGGIAWLYEQSRAGVVILWLVASLALAAGLLSAPVPVAGAELMQRANWVSAGLALGMLLAAMFLGHWYLNWPGMQLAPLRRLVLLATGAVVLRGLFSIVSLSLLGSYGESLVDWTFITWCLVAFRWLAGILGPLLLCGLTWQTLAIPNTQSATGILYAAVIMVFLGELTAQLLSRSVPLPI